MPYLLVNNAGGTFADRVEPFVTADGFDSIAFLVEHYTSHPPASLRYVVPTGRRVRWLVREITRLLASRTGRPLVGFSIVNLAQLGAALHQQLYPADLALPLSDALRLALFERAIADLAAEGDLPFYAPNGKPAWSIIERLAEVITGLRKDGIQPEHLRQDLETTTDDYTIDRARLGDILRIYERYIELLGDRFRDDTAIFNRTAIALATNPEPVDVRPILIEGFTEFRVPELRMLGALASTPIPTCLVLTYSRTNGPLFGNLEETVTTLTSLGYHPRIIDDSDHQQPYRRRSVYLRRWLFNTEQEIRNDAFNDTITILGCTNRVEEVTLIAKYVKHCIATGGYKPHQICVAMRDPERYAGLFRELFAVHGIPANISDRFRLDRAPVTVAVVSALELLVRGWRREDVHRLLSNPLVRCTRPDGTRLDAATIRAVAERYRISGGHSRGGRNGWLQRIDMAHAAARAYAQSLAEDPYSDPLDVRQAEQDVAQLERARADIQRLAELLPESPKTMTAVEFCTFVRTMILEGLGIAASIEETAERMWNLPKASPDDISQLELLEQETRAYAALLRLLDEIEYAWSQVESSARRTLAEYLELLTTMLRGERYQIAEKPSYGVTVTSIEQTRGIPYDVYILCGMVDGEFPQAYSTEYFLGKELPSSEQRHIRAERIQFYEALTNNPAALEHGNWRMLITYPRLTTSGEPLVRSSFIDKLLKVTTLSERCYRTHDLWELWSTGQPLPPGMEWTVSITAPEEVQRFAASDVEDWKPTADVVLRDVAAAQIETATAHPFSAAELERYAECPYQYFAQHILALRQEQTYDLALSNLERGTLIHRILHRFYRTLLDREGTIHPQTTIRSVRLDPTQRDRYLSILLDAATTELDRIRHSHPLFALECEQLLGTAETPGILTEWLDRELARSSSGWEYEVALLETSFGMPSMHSPHTADEPIELTPTLTIRGRIDRIEVSHRNDGVHVLVADYKLHSFGATNTSIRNGQSFQMPLYMLATRQLMQRRYGLEPILDGGIYYIIRPKRDDAYFVATCADSNALASARRRSSTQVVKSYDEQSALLQSAIEHAERIVRSIRRGLFPVAPRNESICARCGFGSLCRIRQLRDDGIITSTSQTHTPTQHDAP